MNYLEVAEYPAIPGKKETDTKALMVIGTLMPHRKSVKELREEEEEEEDEKEGGEGGGGGEEEEEEEEEEENEPGRSDTIVPLGTVEDASLVQPACVFDSCMYSVCLCLCIARGGGRRTLLGGP